MVHVYQTGVCQHDLIRGNFSDMHMAWKTRNALIPDDKRPHDKDRPFIGAVTDFGDNAFVFSFRVHSAHFVKYDQWIKAKKSPFLPYHMYQIWPMYFDESSKRVDAKYSPKYIYQKWPLPIDDELTMKWIKAIDPEFYKTLETCHVPYVWE